MDINRINPYIRRAIPSVLLPGLELKQRVIFDYELVYVESGTLDFCCAGKDYTCSEGDFLFFRPGIPHSFRTIRARLSQPHIHFDMIWAEDSGQVGISFKDYPQLTREERSMIREDLFRAFPPDPILTFRDRERAKQLFYQIVIPGEAVDPLVRKARMTELIGLIVSDHFTQLTYAESAAPNAVPRMVRAYIDASFEMPITLESLEKQFSYNRFYLEKQFIACYGVPIIAYRNRLRMHRAKELLWDHSVTETAELLGYSSVYIFSRAFKNSCGETPSSYLKRAKEARGREDIPS